MLSSFFFARTSFWHLSLSSFGSVRHPSSGPNFPVCPDTIFPCPELLFSEQLVRLPFLWGPVFVPLLSFSKLPSLFQFLSVDGRTSSFLLLLRERPLLKEKRLKNTLPKLHDKSGLSVTFFCLLRIWQHFFCASENPPSRVVALKILHECPNFRPLQQGLYSFHCCHRRRVSPITSTSRRSLLSLGRDRQRQEAEAKDHGQDKRNKH